MCFWSWCRGKKLLLGDLTNCISFDVFSTEIFWRDVETLVLSCKSNSEIQWKKTSLENNWDKGVYKTIWHREWYHKTWYIRNCRAPSHQKTNNELTKTIRTNSCRIWNLVKRYNSQGTLKKEAPIFHQESVVAF